MPKVEGTYAHSLSKVRACEQSEKAISSLLDSFEGTDISIATDGEDNVAFGCKSRGFSISGKVAVKENEVDATVDLPLLAIAFKGLVKAAMDKHIPKYLGDENES